MRRRHGLIHAALGGLALVGLAGCQSGAAPKRVASAEPPLTMPGDPKPGYVAEVPPTRTAGIVERHPLLSKPRQVYENAGTNKVVKVAGATLVGVPMGIVGEIRQIVVGRPPDTKSY